MRPDSPLTNWVPYQLFRSEEEEWMLHWMDLEDRQMKEPFFDDTIAISHLKRREKKRLPSVSSPDFLLAAAAEIPHVPASAFVFHISRCGSTLLSQAFGEEAENIIIAEAPLLDELLRASERGTITDSERKHWFMAALSLLGQRRNGTEQTLIIKLDSWHLHFYDTLRSWYPDTPFFFLLRRPDEVLASHGKQPGIHTVPGMVNKQLLNIDPLKDYGGDFRQFTADVLKGFYEQAYLIQQLQHSKNDFADYGDGISEMIDQFSSFANIQIKDREQLNNRLKYHSKSTTTAFQKDRIPEPKYHYAACMEAYQKLKKSNERL
ncbi:hypothetical protein H9X96_10495 [Pedobacter sp. N36a]|uniref:hypothetical protein n=1 Tax=Pedobacter sp. N36a TaxID=2767996 RepID=UPI001656A1B6|nr:hypothetical protein [Pedobacter sp. N36a]MBC8986202.1 hypothetical protein [Pedobacter sp. N36a]